jgi:hypothetical protein
MSHVAKKPKVEKSFSNAENNGKMSIQELIRSGRVMEFAPSSAAASSAAAARPSSSESMHSYSSHFQPTAAQQSDDPRAKKPWEYRIPEVLDLNLEHLNNMQNAMQSQQVIQTQGDIPSLCLHSSFFVEGVRIGWPFPVIMPPQRQVREISTDETHETVLSGDV